MRSDRTFKDVMVMSSQLFVTSSQVKSCNVLPCVLR